MDQLPGGKHQAPARGRLAGARADAKAGGPAGEVHGQVGFGSGWSHNFLNQKPWHPANFRNQQRVWEAEQKHLAAEKAKKEALAEYEAEREYLATLAYVDQGEAERQRARQSVSFMYMKPPGLDAAMERTGKAAQDAAAGGGGARASSGAEASTSQPAKAARPTQAPGGSGSHVASVLEGIAKAVESGGLVLKQARGARSPTRGGVDAAHANQQFVVGDGSSDEGGGGAAARVERLTDKNRKRLLKAQRKEAEKRKLDEAKQFLAAAGLRIDGLEDMDARKKHKKEKKSKKSKMYKKESRTRDSSSSDGDR